MQGAAVNALANGEFVPYYQPKVALGTGEIVGFEALARWQVSEGEVIGPAGFVEPLESNGFMPEVDFCILRQACAFLRDRIAAGLPVVPMACNFSRLNLLDDAFVSTLLSTVLEYGVPCELLELELTESIAMEDLLRVAAVAEGFKKNGFSLAIDDFGSGYSSLGMLQALPVDVLKIDRSLLVSSQGDSRSRIILESVVTMADRLGVSVVVEGVETLEQAALLQALDPRIVVQGYLCSPAVPRAEAAALLDGEGCSPCCDGGPDCGPAAGPASRIGAAAGFAVSAKSSFRWKTNLTASALRRATICYSNTLARRWLRAATATKRRLERGSHGGRSCGRRRGPERGLAFGSCDGGHVPQGAGRPLPEARHRGHDGPDGRRHDLDRPAGLPARPQRGRHARPGGARVRQSGRAGGRALGHPRGGQRPHRHCHLRRRRFGLARFRRGVSPIGHVRLGPSPRRPAHRSPAPFERLRRAASARSHIGARRGPGGLRGGLRNRAEGRGEAFEHTLRRARRPFALHPGRPRDLPGRRRRGMHRGAGRRKLR
ncbi:MAG: EAL domain-containing protein [Eggerthellaceae bacterium]